MGNIQPIKVNRNYYPHYIEVKNLDFLLARAHAHCLSYERNWAQQANIDIQQDTDKWREDLKKVLNTDYNNNAAISTDDIYNIICNMTEQQMRNYLINSFGNYEGSHELIDKDIIRKFFPRGAQVQPASIIQKQGSIDELRSGFLRQVQNAIQNTGPKTVMSTSKAKFHLQILYDIMQFNSNVKSKVFWENKKGVNQDHLLSDFHFGTFSSREGLNNQGKWLEAFRKEILRLLTMDAVTALNNKNQRTLPLLYTYVRMATEYITTRVTQRQIVFTNSNGDINFGSEIIEGFMNNAKLRIQVSSFYQGKFRPTQLSVQDERFLEDYQQIAKDSYKQQILQILNADKSFAKNYQVSVWYGK